jgi:hypothetical protein
VGAVPVIDSRGALIASLIGILWSIRFSVTLNTELMMVAPPGEPKATSGSPQARRSSSGSCCCAAACSAARR